MKVFVLYHTNGFHLDGDPFDASIYGVYSTFEKAESAKLNIIIEDLIESGFSKEEIALSDKNDELLTEWMYAYESKIKISAEEIDK